MIMDNFMKDSQAPPIKGRWHQLMAECELKVKYSLRKQKYMIEVIEIHGLDILEAQRDRAGLG